MPMRIMGEMRANEGPARVDANREQAEFADGANQSRL